MDPRFTDHLDSIVASERQFFANNYHGDAQNPAVLHVAGTLPILIAAPHAVTHTRHSKPKKADALTGSIAVHLAASVGTHALVLAKTTGEDPNYDSTGAFKLALAEYLKRHEIGLVINLHGMTEKHGRDIVLGTGLGQTMKQQPELLAATVDALSDYGFTAIRVDDPNLFPATYPHNLSQFTWRECQTPSFQMEISFRYRNPVARPNDYMQFIDGLRHTMLRLADHISSHSTLR